MHESGVWCAELLLGAYVLQFYAFADKPFFFDGLKYLRQGFKEVGSAFDGIVENDDCSGFKVWNNVACAGVTAKGVVVVPAYYVPHYDFIALAEHSGLAGANAGIRWTEEV